jgi:hypothetical protein
MTCLRATAAAHTPAADCSAVCRLAAQSPCFRPGHVRHAADLSPLRPRQHSTRTLLPQPRSSRIASSRSLRRQLQQALAGALQLATLFSEKRLAELVMTEGMATHCIILSPRQGAESGLQNPLLAPAVRRRGDPGIRIPEIRTGAGRAAQLAQQM